MSDKNVPTFAVGDEVEFEVDSQGRPVWNFGNSMRANMKEPFRMTIQRVVEVSETFVRTTTDTGKWRWPIPGHPLYDENQWDHPGYLRKRDGVVTQNTSNICRCDSFNLTWFGHDAGCPEKNKADVAYKKGEGDAEF